MDVVKVSKRIMPGVIGGAVAVGILGGCSGAGQPAPPAAPQVSQPVESVKPLPEIKVDAAHMQLGPRAVKPLIYEITEGSGFILDTGGWRMPEPKGLPPGEKIVQVVGGPNKVYSLQYEDGKQRYSVNAPAGFHKGQKLIVGIGYQVTANQKVSFYPMWVGMVNVK